MANTKSAAKRARQTIKRTLANRRVINAVKSKQRKVFISIEDGRKNEAMAAARDFVSAVDKAAKTGRVHKNKANRAKSRMAKALTKLN
ncbi:MAG: 30S ribosomal protein S20 [Chthoniobacteraceae bacterium]